MWEDWLGNHDPFLREKSWVGGNLSWEQNMLNLDEFGSHQYKWWLNRPWDCTDLDHVRYMYIISKLFLHHVFIFILDYQPSTTNSPASKMLPSCFTSHAMGFLKSCKVTCHAILVVMIASQERLHPYKFDAAQICLLPVWSTFTAFPSGDARSIFLSKSATQNNITRSPLVQVVIKWYQMISNGATPFIYLSQTPKSLGEC